MSQFQVRQLPLGYQTQSSDTSPDVEQILVHRWRLLHQSDKAAIVRKATKQCWLLSLIGIYNQYPNASISQVRQEIIRRRLGKEWLTVLCAQDYWRKLKSIAEIETVMEDAIWLALKLADILDRLGIPYLVGGSVASSLLGEPRATLDLDLVIDIQSSQIESLIAVLNAEFYISMDAVYDAVQRKTSFKIVHLESLEKADFFVLDNDVFSQANLQRRQLYTLPGKSGQSIYIYSSEDIILQKLRWYRLGFSQSDRQWRDILGVLKVKAERLDFIYLREWGQTLELSDLLDRALLESGLQEL